MRRHNLIQSHGLECFCRARYPYPLSGYQITIAVLDLIQSQLTLIMHAGVYFNLFHLTNTPPSKTTPFWPSLHLDVDFRECLFNAVQKEVDFQKMISSVHPSVGTIQMYLHSYLLIHSQKKKVWMLSMGQCLCKRYTFASFSFTFVS